MDYHALTTNEITKMESDHQMRVRKCAGECVVVLENDGTLPIEDTSSKIALFGKGARHTVKGGTGSGDVNSRSVVTIEEGLIDAGYKVTSVSWLDRYDKILAAHKEAYLKRIDEKAKETGIPAAMVMFTDTMSDPSMPPISDEDIASAEADAAIYVITRDSGEGGDRYARKGDYYLTDDELRDIGKIASVYDKTVILLNVGGIIDLSELKKIEGINSILLVSQLGNIGGYVVADVIKGVQEPSGRLTDTWAERYEDYPFSSDYSHNNGNTDDEYYREGIYIGYRYFDSFGIEPIYPFGYGLGYTEFEIGNTGIRLDGTSLTVSACVENTGKRSGKETLQVYVSAPRGKIDKPYQELKGYIKSSLLEPGESEELSVVIDIKDCAVFDEETSSRILEKGYYIIRAGHDSRNTVPAGAVYVEEDITTEQFGTFFKPDSEYEELRNPGRYAGEDVSELNVLTLDLNSVKTKINKYQEPRPVLEDQNPDVKLTLDDVRSGKVSLEGFIANLTVPEMAKLCVGAYESDYLSSLNIVGSASLLVPGAAAETTDKFSETRKIPMMILADGPAGLRLQPHFKADKNGDRIIGGEVFGMCHNPFPEDLPEGSTDYYQYCTAIPIATALAQSWNVEYIEDCGRVVGEEMKQFFVHFWLAPGMNIHRNPLCGRNFEYYSEDPLVAGMCAASDTKGVQSLPGQGTTIKHFACNNQEDNRMYSNSHVSPRALRDLYLRGFEIAVKKSHPYSVMTSYNLLNGIHTPNSKELVQYVLRDEWGFDGVVMTDWYTTQEVEFMGEKSLIYPCSSSARCIASGNDWNMPGSEKNVQDVIDAVGSGEITKGDLQFCASNIIRMTLRCFE